MLNSFKSKFGNYFTVGTDSFNFLIFLILIIVSISLRFLHFGEIIDDPHGWRQCDTANYIWSFYKNGVDFFHPSVCWMGGYKTLILEFPLPEAIAAWLFEIFGPSNMLARFVFLFFYCGGVYYLYKICSLFLDKQTSQLATIIYTFLPLSYYYSRALHIDYFALSFSFGMFYYYLVGIKSQSVKKIVIGSLFATVAFLVKAPYAIFFCIPIVYTITKEKKWLFCFKWGILFAIPVVVFIWWIMKSTYINSLAPDWDFIPGYRKFDDNMKWYFGAFEHRFIIRSWNTLINRFYNDLSGGFINIGLLIIGICVSIYKKQHVILWFWLISVIIYLIVFFNLNVIHNYYQIPFVPVFAIFMAIGIVFLSDYFKTKNFHQWIQLFLLGILIYFSVNFSEKKFFTQEKEHQFIGKCIEENTKENDLIIVSYGGLSVHCPIILFRANRNGWSIPIKDLTTKITYNLLIEGCRYLAIIDNQMPGGEFRNFLIFYKRKEIPLSDGKILFLIDLNTTAEGKAYNYRDYVKE